jgi:hypothetical protein
MNAFFTFKLGDLFTGLTRSNQWEWNGPCKAEVGQLDHPNADLSIEPISETDLIGPHVVAKFDQQAAALELQREISTAQTDGTADAMILQHWVEHKGALGVTIRDTNSSAHLLCFTLVGRTSSVASVAGFRGSQRHRKVD